MPLTQQVPAIARGYHYALSIAVSTDDDGPFPQGIALVAPVRDYEGCAMLGQLSTSDGSIYRVDSHHIELQIPAALTARLGNTSAIVAIAQIDGTEPEWLDIAIRLPVFSDGCATGSSTAIVLSTAAVTLSHAASRSPAVLATIANTPASSSLSVTAVAGFLTRASALDSRLAALGA